MSGDSRERYGNSTICVWPWQSIKSLAENTSLFGTRVRKDLVVEKGAKPSEKYHCRWSAKPSEKYHCRWTLLRGKKPKWIFHNLGNLLRPLELAPASRERVIPTEWQVRTVLGHCISRATVIPVQAPQYRQYHLISDCLDIAHLTIREEAALATN